MKKELLKQFETIVRGHIGEFYARAYAVKGDRAEAEVLTVDAIVWGASKFSGLANKERVVDLIVARIGDGSHESMEFTNEENMISRTMERIRSKGKLKSLVWGVVSCVLVLAILGVSIPRLPIDDLIPMGTSETTTQTDAEGNIVQPVIGSVTMKKTKILKSDDEKITLENYHNLSGLLNEKSTIKALHHNDNLVERFCDSVIAPDGTAYMVYNSIKTEDENNTVITLYRMEESGWKALGTGEAQSNYGNYLHSRVYLTADRDSNIYIFVLLDQCVTVYRYDCKTGNFAKSDSSLPCIKPLSQISFSVYNDTSSGTNRIYVGYKNSSLFSFAYYDIEKDEFVSVAKGIGNSINDSMVFCVKNGNVYVVTKAIVSSKSVLDYYCIESDGTVTKTRLFTSEVSWDTDSENIGGNGVGQGGVSIDETGTVHILATHWDGGVNREVNTYLVHYTIDINGNIIKTELPQHYYENSGYHSVCGGFFVGENGNIYYIESYAGAENVITVCELDTSSCGKSRHIDVIELPENIDDYLRINNNSVVFYSDSDQVFYFECSINYE